MARMLKEEEFEAKRSEILDAAQGLVYCKGFRQMTIQDLLDELGISKGAFYHYFDSKHALLEALVGRMVDEVVQLVTPIAQDARLPTMTKLERFFDAVARWKNARKDCILGLLRVWYAEENALVREKVRMALIHQAAPMLGGIVRQGVQEGVLDTAFPERAAEIALSLLYRLAANLAGLLLAAEPCSEDLRRAEEEIAAYTDALERALGAAEKSLTLVDAETLRAWLTLPGSQTSP
jgi:AcrR family transcriptional regulator